jgi:hypothetical protein
MKANPMFKGLQGGEIFPATTDLVAGKARGDEMLFKGIMAFGEGIADGIKEYNRSAELNSAAGSGLDDASTRAMVYMSDPELKGTVEPLLEAAKKAREKGNTQGMLAATKGLEITLGQLPTAYQLQQQDRETDTLIRTSGASLMQLYDMAGKDPRNAGMVANMAPLFQEFQGYISGETRLSRTQARTLGARLSGEAQTFGAKFGLFKEVQSGVEQQAALAARSGLTPTATVQIAADMNVALDFGKSFGENFDSVMSSVEKAKSAGVLKESKSRQDIFEETAAAALSAAETSAPEVKEALGRQIVLARRNMFLERHQELFGISRASTQRLGDSVERSLMSRVTPRMSAAASLGIVNAVNGGWANNLDVSGRMTSSRPLSQSIDSIYERKAAEAFARATPEQKEEYQRYSEKVNEWRALAAGATVNGRSGIEGSRAYTAEEWLETQNVPQKAELDSLQAEVSSARDRLWQLEDQKKKGIFSNERAINRQIEEARGNLDSAQSRFSSASSKRSVRMAEAPIESQIEVTSVMDFREWSEWFSALTSEGMTPQQANEKIKKEVMGRVGIVYAAKATENLVNAKLKGNPLEVEKALERLDKALDGDKDLLYKVAEAWGGTAAAAALTAYGSKMGYDAAKRSLIGGITKAQVSPTPATPPPIPQGTPRQLHLNFYPPPKLVGQLELLDDAGRPLGVGAAPKPPTPAAGAAGTTPAASTTPAAGTAAQTPPAKAGLARRTLSGLKTFGGGVLKVGSGTVTGGSLGKYAGGTGAMALGADRETQENAASLGGVLGSIAGAGLSVGSLAGLGWATTGARLGPQALAVTETAAAASVLGTRYIAAPLYSPDGVSSQEYFDRGMLGTWHEKVGRFSVMSLFWDAYRGPAGRAEVEQQVRDRRRQKGTEIRAEAQAGVNLAEKRMSEFERQYNMPKRTPSAGIAIGKIGVGKQEVVAKKTEEQVRNDFVRLVSDRLGYTPTNIDEMYAKSVEGSKPVLIQQGGYTFQKEITNGMVSWKVLPQLQRSETEETWLAKQKASGNVYDTYVSSDDKDPNAYRINMKGFFRGSDKAREDFNKEVVDTTMANSGLRRLIQLSGSVGSRFSPTDKAEAEALAIDIRGRLRTQMAGGGAPSNYEQIEILKKFISNPTDIFSWPPAELKKLEMLIHRSEQGIVNTGKLSGVSITFGNPQDNLQQKIDELRAKASNK